jgi:hypothetical protein
MKDRFSVGNWPEAWVQAVQNDMPKMSRETRIFLAKVMRVAFEATARMQRKDS